MLLCSPAAISASTSPAVSRTCPSAPDCATGCGTTRAATAAGVRAAEQSRTPSGRLGVPSINESVTFTRAEQYGRPPGRQQRHRERAKHLSHLYSYLILSHLSIYLICHHSWSVSFAPRSKSLRERVCFLRGWSCAHVGYSWCSAAAALWARPCRMAGRVGWGSSLGTTARSTWA